MDTTIAIVWNPSKTDRETLEKGLAKAIATRGKGTGRAPSGGPEPEVTWWETTVDDPGQGIAEKALATSPDLLIVAGGDGTVRAVAEHVADAEADVALGIVPLGTGNLLARNLDVPVGNVANAFARALSEGDRSVDVGWVEVDLEGGKERHGFVVMIGFGIDAQMIAETDEDLKAKAGWLAYVESLGRALKANEIVPFHIAKDDEPGRDEQGHTLLIGNCGVLQGGFPVLPDADPSDGELDYLVLSAEGVGEWLGTLKTMVWDNGLKRLTGARDEDATSESVNLGRARRISVSLPEPRGFQIDGEGMGETTSFEVSIQPGAIRVR